MSIKGISIVLSAHHPWPKINSETEFLKNLNIPPIPYRFRDQPYQDAAICLEIGTLHASDYKQYGTELYEEFEKALQKCLLHFAEWLAIIPTENMERVRAAGMRVWVIINFLMDQDQMDFNLLPALSAQLGRLGLQLYLISNE